MANISRHTAACQQTWQAKNVIAMHVRNEDLRDLANFYITSQ
jgi:hypothetical protein